MRAEGGGMKGIISCFPGFQIPWFAKIDIGNVEKGTDLRGILGFPEVQIEICG
jgi:hypothetical protein